MRAHYKAKKHFGITDLLWPLVWAMLSLAGYFVIVAIIYLLNLLIKSTLLEIITNALFQLLYIIFGIALVSSYTRHFQRVSGLYILVPGLMTISVTLIIYFITYILEELNKLVGASFLDSVTGFINDRLLFIFVVILILSYSVMLISKRH